jgi:hypothetical protein
MRKPVASPGCPSISARCLEREARSLAPLDQYAVACTTRQRREHIADNDSARHWSWAAQGHGTLWPFVRLALHLPSGIPVPGGDVGDSEEEQCVSVAEKKRRRDHRPNYVVGGLAEMRAFQTVTTYRDVVGEARVAYRSGRGGRCWIRQRLR